MFPYLPLSSRPELLPVFSPHATSCTSLHGHLDDVASGRRPETGATAVVGERLEIGSLLAGLHVLLHYGGAVGRGEVDLLACELFVEVARVRLGGHLRLERWLQLEGVTETRPGHTDDDKGGILLQC